jgi:hypothetical protein
MLHGAWSNAHRSNDGFDGYNNRQARGTSGVGRIGERINIRLERIGNSKGQLGECGRNKTGAQQLGGRVAHKGDILTNKRRHCVGGFAERRTRLRAIGADGLCVRPELKSTVHLIESAAGERIQYFGMQVDDVAIGETLERTQAVW